MIESVGQLNFRMLDVNDTELVFAFPDVDEEAILRVCFSPTGSPSDRMGIEHNAGMPLRLAAEGSFLMCLQPNTVHRDYTYHSIRPLHYPFAVLISVGGKNAITGLASTTLDRSPQNYFVSPPQGGIDGCFHDGRVHDLRAIRDATMTQSLFEVRVFPMKAKTLDYFKSQLRLIPGPGASALRGITLIHGGGRKCEPIYEDNCGFGSWDRDNEERASLWVAGGS